METIKASCIHFYVHQIEEKSFIASEKLFSQISENVLARMSKMIRKYHLLCLKDAAVKHGTCPSLLL